MPSQQPEPLGCKAGVGGGWESTKTIISIAESPPSMCFMKVTAYLYGYSGSRQEQQFRLKTKDDERNAEAFTGSDRGNDSILSLFQGSGNRAIHTEA